MRNLHITRLIARALYAAIAHAVRNRASVVDGAELTGLVLIALCRAESPTRRMWLGQVAAKARRIERAKRLRDSAAYRASALVSHA